MHTGDSANMYISSRFLERMHFVVTLLSLVHVRIYFQREIT